MVAASVLLPSYRQRRRRPGAEATCQFSMPEYPARRKPRADWPSTMSVTSTMQSGNRCAEYMKALRSGSGSAAPACSDDAAVRWAGIRLETGTAPELCSSVV